MTAREDWQADLLQIVLEHEAADKAARRAAEAEHWDATAAKPAPTGAPE